MNPFKRALVLAALATVGIASAAEAAAIRISEITSAGVVLGEITINDDGPGDLSAADGAIVHSGVFRGFDLTLEAGITKPAFGSEETPRMFFSFLTEIGARGAGILQIAFSDTDFGTAATTGVYVGARMDSGVVFQVLQDTGNSLFAGAVVGTTISTTDNFAFVDTFPVANDPSYSLTQRFTFALSEQEQSKTVGFSLVAVVPDGGLSLGLLGFALVGIEGLRRRFKK